MFIVIEGLSRTGKTTLAKELARRMDIKHHGRRPDVVHKDAIDSYVLGKAHGFADIDWRNTDLIMDRQIPSSVAFSAWRNRMECADKWFPIFQALDGETPCTYIYLKWNGPIEQIWNALLADDESIDMELQDLEAFENDIVNVMMCGTNDVIEINTHHTEYKIGGSGIISSLLHADTVVTNRKTTEELADQIMVHLNQHRITWTNYFMSMAHLAKRRSTGLTRHVGAVIALDNKVVGIGYNGAPSGVPHCTVNPRAGMQSGENLRLERTVHAEINAILNASSSLRGGTIYTTTQPCGECTKALINSGIVRIIYDNSYRDAVAKELLSHTNIEVYRWES